MSTNGPGMTDGVLIDKLLVANRGEIARRVMRTAHEMGMRTVAVYVDADTGAPFVGDADEAYLLRGGSYLDGGAIVEVALRCGAGAVHPGYGFLSENPGFARAVVEAGLTWVGPPAEAIAAMGDKLAAKQLASRIAVPTLATVDDPAMADAVGYPLLVKAAAGGGGKGMRVVASAGDLAEAVGAARREAGAAFGDERVFLERYVARSRHVEIQVLGDRHGHLVHLGERECSIQRRHQKILEEAPSPAVDDELRERMGEAALRLGRALGYQSAGTVEFLLDAEPGPDGSREFWFLEVNTRLQVEHPVTEAVTGLDLVREQLRIAMGEPLGYAQGDVTMTGHAVEARLYAEDPAKGFLPAAGTVEVWAPAPSPEVRWDSGVEAGTVVGVQFDPILAKVVAHGPTRAEAARRLALALERTAIAGVVTNRDFLVSTLRHAAFLAGDTSTDFIDRVQPPRGRRLGPEGRRDAAILAALWRQGANRRDAPVLGHLPSGWRNSRLPPERVVFHHDGEELAVSYRARRDGTFQVGEDGLARLLAWTPTSVDLELDGRRLKATVAAWDDRLAVCRPDGAVELVQRQRFPEPTVEGPVGGLAAPMPGRVVEVRAAVGDEVRGGQVLVIMEAMKMEHHLAAAEDGVVAEVRVSVGDQVPNGMVLLVVESGKDRTMPVPSEG